MVNDSIVPVSVRGRAIIPIVTFLLFFHSVITCNAQLPQHLELHKPTINGQYIAAGGTVLNTVTKNVILSVDSQAFLTSSSIYYSNGSGISIHSKLDGHLITTVPGRGFNYSRYSKILWTYSKNNFNAYSENGQSVSALTFTGTNAYPFQNEVRYVRESKLYKYGFTNSSEQLVGSFDGSFSAWFFDGQYFLTQQSTIIRVYDKNATLVTILDTPATNNLGGNGNFFWSSHHQPDYLEIRKVSDGTLYTYNIQTLGSFVATPNNIALLEYGFSSITIINLNGGDPGLNGHVGAGPYVEAYDCDLNGNWTTGSRNGVVNYGTLVGNPQILNTGKIRSMHGDENSNLVLTTSSGNALVYKFNNASITHVDTIQVNSDEAKVSLDGKYLAAGGNRTEAQYADNELSLYVYDLTTKALIKKWYYNYFHDNSSYLNDFDFSKDGQSVGQMISQYNGTTWLYSSFAAKVNSADSVFLNNNQNINAPLVSPTTGFAITSPVGGDIYHPYTDVSKLYNPAGALSNAYSGFVTGWISDTRLVFNRIDSTQCSHGFCQNFSSPQIISLDGQVDTSFIFPDSIYNGSQAIKTRSITTPVKISDHELYINNSNVIDLKTGRVLFAFDTVPSMSTPVGTDYIVYLKNNNLEIINWRSLSLQVWYKDADKDGFGNPVISKLWYKQPDGFVSNNNDCNDSDGTLNPNTKWYEDHDGDGFGNAQVVVASCLQPTGYVKNNTDCDDTNQNLTPLNHCVIAAVDEQNTGLNIYPNPGSGVFYIRSSENISDIRIINGFGQTTTIQTVKSNDVYTIDLTDKPQGLYIVNVKGATSDLHIKIIKR